MPPKPSTPPEQLSSKKLVILPAVLQGGEDLGLLPLSPPPPIAIDVAGGGDGGSSNAASPASRSPSVAVARSPAAAQGGGRHLEEQRHKLMQDMQDMQSRLLGEQRVLQSMLQEQADKEDSYSSLVAAVEEQEESLRLEKQMLADSKREEAKRIKFDVDMAKHDVTALQFQVERLERLEAENAEMERKIREVRQQRTGQLLSHATQQSDLNEHMLRFRHRLEDFFRKSVFEHTKTCKRMAFDALLERDKHQLLRNLELDEEISLQRVGMENLMYRFQQLGMGCRRVREEIESFQGHSTAYAHQISELRKLQRQVDARAQDIASRYADVYQEHEQLRRGANLQDEIVQLRREIDEYESSCQLAQAQVLKWRQRLSQARASRGLLHQHIVQAHGPHSRSSRHSSSSSATGSHGSRSSSSRSTIRVAGQKALLGQSTCGRSCTPLDPRLIKHLLRTTTRPPATAPRPASCPAAPPPPPFPSSTTHVPPGQEEATGGEGGEGGEQHRQGGGAGQLLQGSTPHHHQQHQQHHHHHQQQQQHQQGEQEGDRQEEEDDDEAEDEEAAVPRAPGSPAAASSSSASCSSCTTTSLLSAGALVRGYGLQAAQARMAEAPPIPTELYTSFRQQLHDWSRDLHRHGPPSHPSPLPHSFTTNKRRAAHTSSPSQMAMMQERPSLGEVKRLQRRQQLRRLQIFSPGMQQQQQEEEPPDRPPPAVLCRGKTCNNKQVLLLGRGVSYESSGGASVSPRAGTAPSVTFGGGGRRAGGGSHHHYHAAAGSTVRTSLSAFVALSYNLTAASSNSSTQQQQQLDSWPLTVRSAASPRRAHMQEEEAAGGGGGRPSVHGASSSFQTVRRRPGPRVMLGLTRKPFDDDDDPAAARSPLRRVHRQQSGGGVMLPPALQATRRPPGGGVGWSAASSTGEEEEEEGKKKAKVIIRRVGLNDRVRHRYYGTTSSVSTTVTARTIGPGSPLMRQATRGGNNLLRLGSVKASVTIRPNTAAAVTSRIMPTAPAAAAASPLARSSSPPKAVAPPASGKQQQGHQAAAGRSRGQRRRRRRKRKRRATPPEEEEEDEEEEGGAAGGGDDASAAGLPSSSSSVQQRQEAAAAASAIAQQLEDARLRRQRAMTPARRRGQLVQVLQANKAHRPLTLVQRAQQQQQRASTEEAMSNSSSDDDE